MPERGRETAGGPRPAGFNFTRHMRGLCADMVQRLPALHHVQMDQVLVCFAQARKRQSFGMYASLTPLRFHDGALTTHRRGQLFMLQRLFDPHGRELLYILTFYLPRFMDLPFHDKLITVLHELWHISPQFNGDLRRHPGAATPTATRSAAMTPRWPSSPRSGWPAGRPRRCTSSCAEILPTWSPPTGASSARRSAAPSCCPSASAIWHRIPKGAVCELPSMDVS